MKALRLHLLEDFLYRFEHFRNSELSSIDVISPTSVKFFVNVQDRKRSFDWIGIDFLFEEVVEANLVENEKLHLLDMDAGMTILYENGLFYFMVGDYKSANGTKSALCYIIAKTLKYEETQANL